MPSAFAMFAPVLPAAAGTPVAAPGVQDDQTAGLFSSKLAEVVQAASKADTPRTGAANHALGRLSLSAIAMTDLDAPEATPTPGLVADIEGEAAAPDASEPATPPSGAADAEQAVADTVNADAAVISQVVVATVAPTALVTLASETPSVVDASAEAALSAPIQGLASPQPPVGAPQAMTAPNTADAVATQPVPTPDTPQLADAKAIALTPDLTPPVSARQVEGEISKQDAAAPLETTPPVATLPADKAPVAQTAKPAQPIQTEPAAYGSEKAAPLPATPVVQASAASPLKTTEAASAEAPTSPDATAALSPDAPAETKIETTATKIDVKVSVQPAVPATQPLQTAAAVAVKQAVAEALKTVDDQGETTVEAPMDSALTDAISPQTADAPAPAPAKAPTPVSTLLAAPLPPHARSTPAETTVTSTLGQTSIGDHVAMADASPTLGQATTTDPTAAVAAPTADTTAAAAVSPLDPAAPVDTPSESRPLDATPATPQATTASSLSRATIETTAQLAAQIARKLEGRSTRFDMVLTPEDLGRVDVSLEIGSDGQLAARLVFDNPAAAAELRGRADELRRQLQDAGFQVAGDSLDFTQRDLSSGGGFDRQQQHQRQSLFAGASRLADHADLPPARPPGAWTNHSLTRDRVDVRV